MPSDPHEALIKKLSEITTTLQKALDENDFGNLASLSEAHEMVFQELKAAGLSQNPDLITPVKEAIAQVESICLKLKKKKEGVRQKLTALGNRKKLLGAYHHQK